MSGKNDVVELESNLTEALEKGGDAALDQVLRGLTVEDDGQPDDDDAEATAVAAADAGGANGDDKVDGEDPDSAGGSDDKGKAAADVAASDATEASKKADAAKDDQGSRPGDDAPAPVQNKNGTGTIPYAVLSDARKRAARADQLEADLAEANRKLDEAQQQLKSRPGGTASADDATKTVAELDELSDEDFADLPPEVQKLHRKVKLMEAKLEQVGVTTKSIETEHKQNVQDTTQEVIDQVPDLVAWQAKGGALWRIAVDKDDELKADPKWANKPMKERFEEVVRLTREELGLPAPSAVKDPKTTTQTGAKGGATAAKAADDAVPSSLSEIQGGGAPDLDIHDSIEKTSVVGLAHRMGAMRDSDIDALLAKMS